jgi:hypothetical protein
MPHFKRESKLFTRLILCANLYLLSYYTKLPPTYPREHVFCPSALQPFPFSLNEQNTRAQRHK